MTNFNSLLNKKKIHFIGIGGISMSGLAEIVHHRGFTVSGSDMKTSGTTSHLEDLGITVYYGHSKNNISPDIDLVVYTAAIKDDNAELLASKALGLELITRSRFLGLIMKDYNFPICIAGTHGKTTTTSMLSHGVLSAELDPTITVGGILKGIDGNIRIGNSEYFITEACEYCDSFLDFFPKIGVILNVEADHLDYFKDITHIRQSFQKFACSIPTDGFLTVNSDIEELDEFLAPITCKVETFGLYPNADWYAEHITFDDKACASFDVYYKGLCKGHITLNVPGIHNVLNCLSVCAVCNFLGLSVDILGIGLAHFTGANQRFEIKGKIHDITLVDDYAHHPTEIKATLDVANAYPHHELYIIFQPHTYTRTKAFLKDFAKVLSSAAHIIITDIYAAREKNPGDISSEDIVQEIHNLGKEALYISDFDEIANYLLEHAVPGDLIITLGAGNINQVIDILLGR